MMKKSLFFSTNHLLICLLTVFIFATGCSKKTDNPIKYPNGTFPDTVINMGSINSQYDDFNLDSHVLTGNGPILFSSNRISNGGQFDLVQGLITFSFDQTDGIFELNSSIYNDVFLNTLITKAVTPGNDFGPYRFFSTSDGYEYLLLSSMNTNGNLDLYYLRHRPRFNQSLPDISGPFPASIFNSGLDDAYFSLDGNQDTAYFCSSRSGNFDIYYQPKPGNMNMDTWLIQNAGTPAQVDSINSGADDKCPQVLNKIMVFASDRPGGIGGFDLYYSVLRRGKWSAPVNFGPSINTNSNEYRPVLGWHEEYLNYFLMFSSDRPEGEGGYDLYFTGIDNKKLIK